MNTNQPKLRTWTETDTPKQPDYDIHEHDQPLLSLYDIDAVRIAKGQAIYLLRLQLAPN